MAHVYEEAQPDGVVMNLLLGGEQARIPLACAPGANFHIGSRYVIARTG